MNPPWSWSPWWPSTKIRRKETSGFNLPFWLLLFTLNKASFMTSQFHLHFALSSSWSAVMRLSSLQVSPTCVSVVVMENMLYTCCIHVGLVQKPVSVSFRLWLPLPCRRKGVHMTALLYRKTSKNNFLAKYTEYIYSYICVDCQMLWNSALADIIFRYVQACRQPFRETSGATQPSCKPLERLE